MPGAVRGRRRERKHVKRGEVCATVWDYAHDCFFDRSRFFVCRKRNDTICDPGSAKTDDPLFEKPDVVFECDASGGGH